MTNYISHPDHLSVLDNASGKIRFNLQNDVVFHLVMERSKLVLTGLICSLLGLRTSDIKDIVVINPIDFSSPVSKEIILDVKVSLNNLEIIDIELQTYYDDEWNDHSLLYLCRAFDNILKGEDYDRLRKATLIAIMDYSPFINQPLEFYSRFQLLNLKYNYPYSSKFSLNVLNFSCSNLATEEDIKNGLVHWANLFRATTWDEIKLLAQNNNIAKEVGEIMYSLNTKEELQAYYMEEAHERWLALERSRIKREQHAYHQGYTAAKDEDAAIIADLKAKIEALES